MRRAEGVDYGDWEGRQIEVGDAGWKVLTDWEQKEERRTRGTLTSAASSESLFHLEAA